MKGREHGPTSPPPATIRYVEDPRIEVVKRMWIDFREQGVEVALACLHPEVEFQLDDGTISSATSRCGRSSAASRAGPVRRRALHLRALGEGVVVAGHRRIQTHGTSESEYTYFSHHVKDGLITRMAAWPDRDSATTDLTG